MIMSCCYSSIAFLLLFWLCHISLIEALGFSVELIHRDSPKSPFYQPTQTHFQRLSNALRRSINRANHRFNQSSSIVKSNVAPVSDFGGEYIVSYSIGTPPFQTFGYFDTGSDLMWLQCKPCEFCYNQTTPIFDPSKSTTYKKVPCNSDTCYSERYLSCSSNHNNFCQYNFTYLDKTNTTGDLILESLTLDSDSSSSISFPNIVFGCGHNNHLSANDQSSGIVGFGVGRLSFISQMSSSIGARFSYCLVPLSLTNTSSKLNFGEDAIVNGNEAISTPMLPNYFYIVTLSAFSVGDNRIEFGNSPPYGGNYNTVIDSGSTQIVLPADIYNRLESAVAKVVTNLERTKDPTGIMSLCYKATLDELKVPVITAHFSGADVRLNTLNTFLQVAEEVVCLAFVSVKFPYIIYGNLAQQNFLVGYDLQKFVVSFKPTDCTKQ
ncbi:hypothetical protein RIF29_13674 [Crotalaria pallida]|uniref:Peptidase A1 domain-containing protein n=1 Tax=Crotalaria pallida TaxID=3830 RepID=A0AAN9P2J0_CROPI